MSEYPKCWECGAPMPFGEYVGGGCSNCHDGAYIESPESDADKAASEGAESVRELVEKWKREAGGLAMMRSERPIGKAESLIKCAEELAAALAATEGGEQ